MPFSRLGLLLFTAAGATALGCSLIVEFDEAQIPTEDTGITVDETSVDTGTDTALPDTNVEDSGDDAADSGSPDTGAGETDVDTGAADTGAADTGAADTGPEDTGTADTGPFDTGTPDTGPFDTGTPDTGPFDTGTADTGPFDTGTPDTGPEDTGTADTGPADTGPEDTGVADTGPEDTGVADTGPADTGTVEDADSGPSTASFTSELTGLQAGTASTATGTVKCTLTYASKQLACTVTHGLAAATAAHVHLGAAGVSGGVVLAFGTTLTSPFTGTWTLTDPQLLQLQAREYYVNVHTAAFSNGEIRGQLLTPGETLYSAQLTAVSGVTTSGTGNFGIVKLLDGTFVYSGSASGLNADATTAVIDDGTTTPVDLNMSVKTKDAVRFTGNLLSTALDTTILDTSGGYFVNVNTDSSTGGTATGEIRGNVVKQFTAPAP